MSSGSRLEQNLARWCVERALHDRDVGHQEARGILVAVLTTLAIDPISMIWRPRVYSGIATPPVRDGRLRSGYFCARGGLIIPFSSSAT